MSFREFIQKMINQYFMILAGILATMIMYCKLYYPEVTLSANDLGFYFLEALVADLPALVLYSKNELNQVQYGIRRILHFLLLEAVVVGLGAANAFISSLQEGLVVVIAVAVVYLFVCFFSYLTDYTLAKDVNEKLKQRRDADEQKD